MLDDAVESALIEGPTSSFELEVLPEHTSIIVSEEIRSEVSSSRACAAIEYQVTVRDSRRTSAARLRVHLVALEYCLLIQRG